MEHIADSSEAHHRSILHSGSPVAQGDKFLYILHFAISAVNRSSARLQANAGRAFTTHCTRRSEFSSFEVFGSA